MNVLEKKLLISTAIAFAGGGLVGFVLWYFTHDQALTFTAGGMFWFVLQLALTIKAFEHHADPDENQFKP
ncbi:MAG: hypothetical protein AB1861_19000 [Cyanobacteriota bacterium]